MKRTKNINKNAFRKVGQYALPFVVALAVTGCEQADIDMKMYKNVDECIADTHKPDQCRAARLEAEKVANETAPRYATASDCQEEFGDQCHYNPSSNAGGSSWMPYMVGYMMGQNNSSYSSAPLYRSRSGSYMDNTMRSYNVQSGKAFKVTKSAAKPSFLSPRTSVASRSSTSSRGGFGKSMSSRSSFGG